MLVFLQLRSDGNPFWAMEFARSMRDGGFIEVDVSRCCILTEDLDQLEFPTSVEGLITSRMDRLPLNHQLLMKVASVFNDEFSLVMLRNVLESDKVQSTNLDLGIDVNMDNDLPKMLGSLCAADMLVQDPAGQVGVYQFKHSSLQEVSYTLLPDILKKTLHHAAAQYYEQQRAVLSMLSPRSRYDLAVISP